MSLPSTARSNSHNRAVRPYRTIFRAVKTTRTAGWVTQTEEVSFCVETDNGRDYTAFSNVCTHLGCRVRWVGGQEEFFCPSHGAVFSKSGEVVSGPPPRPLDNFEVRETDGKLEVNFSV